MTIRGDNLLAAALLVAVAFTANTAPAADAQSARTKLGKISEL